MPGLAWKVVIAMLEINKDEKFSPFIEDEIREHGAWVDIDEAYYLDGALDLSKVSNLAVDDFFNAQGLESTPASIDNLFVIDRGGKYSVYMVELKDVASSSRICLDNVGGKFCKTISELIDGVASAYYAENSKKVIDVNLWLVSPVFAFMRHGQDITHYDKKIRGTLVERLLLMKPYRVFNKIARLQPMPCGELIS